MKGLPLCRSTHLLVFCNPVVPRDSSIAVPSSISFLSIIVDIHDCRHPPNRTRVPGRIGTRGGSTTPVRHTVWWKHTEQFARDMAKFLDARAKKIVVGGLMVIIMDGIPDGRNLDQLPAGVMYDLIGSILLDMANEGMITETQVDSFNLPIYTASPKEIKDLMRNNGRFAIKTLELTNPAAWLNGGNIDMQEWTDHVRAAMEGLFSTHFSPQLVNEIFCRLVGKLEEHSERIESSYREKIQLLVILRRV